MADKSNDKVGEHAFGGELPPSVIRLIDDGRRVTAGKVWRVLEDEERVASLRLLMRRRKDREELVQIVAKARKFRPASVSGMDSAKIVQMAMGLSLPPSLLVSMLDEMHMERRREMLAHFLGALGIPNDDGAVERFEDHDPGEREVRAAANDLVREHGLRRSVVYFLTLVVLRVRFADHLWTWMRRLAGAGHGGALGADDAPGGPLGTAKDGGAAAREAEAEDAEGTSPEDDASKIVSSRPSTPGDEEATRGQPASQPSQEVLDHLPSVDPELSDPSAMGPELLVSDGTPVDRAAEEAEDPLPTADGGPPGSLADEVDAHPVGEPDVALQPTLRTLDNLLIGALVDSRQGVEGCLDEDQISDAVDEFVNLNGRRHQSYFHAGFRDALFGHPKPRELAAENESRLRWYWAGVVLGWARRRGSSRRIVEAYDANPVVRDLGDGRDATTEEAAPHVLHALWREGREREVVDFLKVPGMLSSPSLFAKAFEVGTALLRDDHVTQADAIFDGLLGVVRVFEALVEGADGVPAAGPRKPGYGLFTLSRQEMELRLETTNAHAVRRRRAHCLQRLIEYHRARQLLEELMEVEEDPNYLAMANADLGLIAGRFSELDEVALPARRQDFGDFIDRLRAGKEHYERAVTEDVPYAAHGEYCLGVIALGEGRWGDAENHLRAARARFGGTGYREALAARTDLYFGIARAAHARSVQDVAHAGKVMARALVAGARFPRYLFAPAVEGLRYGAGIEDLATFANALVRHHGNEALDELSRSDTILGDCPTVLDALRRRASQRGVSEVAAADYRRCLVGYLKAGRLGEARTVLDRLEDLARQRVGTNEFQELLAESGYQPAWDPEDATIARVGVLEARGEIEDAFTELEKLFWSFLGHPNRLRDAKGILERIRRLGVDAHYFEGHEKALAARTDEPAAEVAHPVDRAPVKVLFVGGDERQAKAMHAVMNRLRREAPHIEVTFVFPGWSGNWHHTFNEVRGKIKTHDALALMRLVRTEFGRQCRRCCGAESKPWRSCWVAGQKAMAESIIAAANAVG